MKLNANRMLDNIIKLTLKLKLGLVPFNYHFSELENYQRKKHSRTSILQCICAGVPFLRYLNVTVYQQN